MKFKYTKLTLLVTMAYLVGAYLGWQYISTNNVYVPITFLDSTAYAFLGAGPITALYTLVTAYFIYKREKRLHEYEERKERNKQ